MRTRPKSSPANTSLKVDGCDLRPYCNWHFAVIMKGGSRPFEEIHADAIMTGVDIVPTDSDDAAPATSEQHGAPTMPEDGHGAPATFDGAVQGLRETGASVGTRELVELIVRHGAEEGALLATYEELSTEAPDEGVRYLIRMILEDEHRHHRLLAELSNAMAWGVTTKPPVATVPRMPGNISGALLDQTKLLRKSEDADYKDLKRIKRSLRPFADTTLWVLIVDLMLLDTKKHATILRFLERQRKGR